MGNANGAEAALALSPALLRQRFAAAFEVRPRIYWCDMLASAGLGWVAFVWAARSPLASGAWLLGTAIATLALYRAVLFIHEIAHLRRRAVPGFEAIWNLAVGLPLLVPSLMYVGTHGDHHRRSSYGTRGDPEYEPLAHWSRTRIALASLQLLAVPVLLALRWGVLGPLSRLLPPLRPVVVERLSTLGINASYRRRPPRGRQLSRWASQEAGGAALVWAVASAFYLGWLPLSWLGQWYAVAAPILLLNHLRTLAAHRYENRGDPLDDEGQLRDSVNLLGSSWLAELVAPVGLRYHALHHLLPTLPYHSLGRVHRELCAGLPSDSPYRAVESAGVWVSVRELLAGSRRDAAPFSGERAV